MTQLSSYQRATKWFFILMSTTIFLIGGYSLFAMRGSPFNPGWIVFGLITLLGLLGIIFGAHHFASRFRKELPEGENKTGAQPAYMDKEMQRVQFRQLPAMILAVIGILGLMISERGGQILNLQIFTSLVLISVGIIGIQAYRYEIFVVYPSMDYGNISVGGWIRRVWRGEDAKRWGIALISISVIGLIFFWIILPNYILIY